MSAWNPNRTPARTELKNHEHCTAADTGKQLSRKALNAFIVSPLFKTGLYVNHKAGTRGTAMPQQRCPGSARQVTHSPALTRYKPKTQPRLPFQSFLCAQEIAGHEQNQKQDSRADIRKATAVKDVPAFASSIHSPFCSKSSIMDFELVL